MSRGIFYILLIVLIPNRFLSAQNHYTQQKAVVYEEVYDDPSDINKLFIGIQPLYAELFASNVNAGFGLEAHYFYKDKFDVKAHFRRPWVAGFYDLNRDQATKVGLSANIPTGFSFYEIDFNYHFKESIFDSKTTMVLFRKSYKDSKWASRVPLRTSVPASVRKIYGARAGGYAWKATLNVNTIMRLQSQDITELTTQEGQSIPATVINAMNQPEAPTLFSNISSPGFFLGVSLTQIRNILIDFEGYEPGNDDSIFSVYFDILYSPAISIEPIEFQGQTYLANSIKTAPLGARFGIDGKFNRSLGWAYGAEIGYRPSAAKGTFFTQFKLAIPVLGTKLDNTITEAQQQP